VSRFHRVGALILLAILFFGCNSDETVSPAPIPCDNEDAGGFSIAHAERGRVYVWGGTGVAGTGEMGHSPGYTQLYWPIDVSFDPDGKPIVVDWNNHRVLALDADGKFQKLIGRNFGMPTDGPALETDLNHPTHVCFSSDGSKLFLAACHNAIVMEMDMATAWIARYCGTGSLTFNGDGLDRLSSGLMWPVCVEFSPIDGGLYVVDSYSVVRRIDENGIVHVIAGTAPVSNGQGVWIRQVGYAGDGGPALGALLNVGYGKVGVTGGICFDRAGNLYIADRYNHAVRIVTPHGIIDTFAGKGPTFAGHSGDGGPARDATLNEPRDVAVDVDGSVFIADTGNHVIRKVDPSGIISTAVGVVRPTNSNPISACDLHDEQGAPAREVHLTAPYGIELDADGNLWIADTQNNVIRIFYR
jgi:hypothetical protein